MNIKKTAAALMAAAMMLGTTAVTGGNAITASAAKSRNGICTYTYIDVKTDADAYASKAGWLDGGDAVSILGEKYDSNGELWYKIQYELLIGYVPAASISENGKGYQPADYSGDFESYMESQGFPESYRIYLRKLHEQHPSWIFKAQHLDIDWNNAVNAETVVGRNLVHNGAPESWKSKARGAYDANTGTWYQLDTGWVAASDEIIKYYLDPRNFLSENYVFMFENLSYDPAVHTRDGVEAILSGTFMDGGYTCPDTWEWFTYADTFMEAAEISGVSPYHLASRCRNEQGVYGAPQSLGTIWGYENYFNFFDVGAYATASLTAGEMAARYATNYDPDYLLPWTNQYKSIVGGSIFLGNGYINREQDTLYLQKFDMVDGGNGYYAHQYMTCVFGQANEAVSLLNAYSDDVLASAMEFKIPVYDNMPETRCLKPGTVLGEDEIPVKNSGKTVKKDNTNNNNNTNTSNNSNSVSKVDEKYDINSDGNVNITDASVMTAHILSRKAMNSSSLKKADIDKNGRFEVTDAILVIKYLKNIV